MFFAWDGLEVVRYEMPQNRMRAPDWRGAVGGALKEMMAMSDEERAAMGARGREWIRRDFSWKGIGAQMKAAYEWLLGKRPRPEWVRVD